MRGLIQRVTSASVDVAGETVGKIDRGLLLLLGVEADDTDSRCRRLAERVVNYRIFPDSDDKMNLNVQQAGGAVLVVSQFTLVADTRKGNRPGFSSSAPPEMGARFYKQFIHDLRKYTIPVETGCFGANMQVSLVNDGPVTFLLES